MNAYQYWLDYFNILFAVLLVLLSWNTTFWIKDKINRILSFLVLIIIYDLILHKFLKIDTYELATKNDQVLEFIYLSFIQHTLAKDSMLYLSMLSFFILIIRIAYQFYQKHKAKIPN